MRVIVPGGYYSYDSAGKKIWLDYQYYGTTLENIERVKNLTRNKILYDCKLSKEPVTVANGCITHSYQGTEADADKIQVTLRTPITNSLTELTPVDGVVTLSTDGKVLVLPTENAAVLPSFNEYVLNPNRLTIAESPFGGLKTGSPDYCPGTLYTPTDGVYLTDVAGNNSTKTLTAGMLKGVNGLTVDTTAHTITEEFVIANTSESNTPTVIDACDNTTGWDQALGTVSDISSDGSSITFTGVTDSLGRLAIQKTFSVSREDKQFLTFSIISDVATTGQFRLSEGTTKPAWYGSRFPVAADVETKFCLPIDAPAATTGQNPVTIDAGTKTGTITNIYLGIRGVASETYTVTINNICLDCYKAAYVELQTPDNIAPSSLSIQTHNGTAYETATRVDSLDGAHSNVSIDTTKAKFLDGTLLDHVYGTGFGLAVFPKGVSGAEVTGSTGTMTYSANKGTRNRVGVMVMLPPCDGRTNFSKFRGSFILTSAPDAEGNYSASYDFEDSANTSYGLQNLSKPWIALYDPTASLIDFYLFTHRPQSLSFKRDETGTIHELNLYPGTGSVHHGQITFADLALDSDSDLIPDFLEAAVNGSIPKFLQLYNYAGEPVPVSNDIDGNLSVALLDATDSVPTSMFVSKAAYPQTWTAAVTHNAELGCADFVTSAENTGVLYIGGLVPATESTYIVDIGLDSDATNSEMYFLMSPFQVIATKTATGYRIKAVYTDDTGASQSPYVTVPNAIIVNNRIKIYITCNEIERTVKVWHSDSYTFTVPYRNSSARNIPYTYVIPPMMYCTTYLGAATSLTAHIYSVEQTIPRRIITATGNNKITSFGIDYPRQDKNTLGIAYMGTKAQVGVAWADTKYLSEPEMAFTQSLLDAGWELGIHFKLTLNNLTLEEAYAHIDSEVQLIEAAYGQPVTSWCSLANGDTVTHAIYAYNKYGMLWRNGPTGISFLQNVGTLWTDTWAWWTEALARNVTYPAFTHDTDIEPAIAYCIDYSKFTDFCDTYNEAGIDIVGFYEYTKRNSNQKDASFSILRNTDGYLRFTVQTNGYPCTVNVPSTSAHVEIYNQSGVAVPFSTLADSVSFEVENGGEYVVIKS